MQCIIDDIHGFGFAVSYSKVEYKTGKFKSDSLVFQRKLINLKVKISILTGYSAKPTGKKYSDITFLMAKQVCKCSVTWTKIVSLGLCDGQKRSQQSLRAQLNFYVSVTSMYTFSI